MSKEMDNEGNINCLSGQYYVQSDGGWMLTDAEGHPFFRKYFVPGCHTSAIEKHIVQLIQRNPHQDLIRIFSVTSAYYDAELLDTEKRLKREVISDVQTNLEQLHRLGIIYVDLKDDNMGYSYLDDRWKLFDFDCSGTISELGTWEIEAPFYFQYKLACKIHTVSDVPTFEMHKCSIDPLVIDDILFQQFQSQIW
jgi:serine/threonine protein kinase